jgi:trehalose 6-phosphate synthase/phosphatase
MPTSSPFVVGDSSGGAGSPIRVDRMVREHGRRYDIFASDAMDTDGAEPASASAGPFAVDGVQSPGRVSPANMEDAGGAAAGHAARPPLAGSRSGFRRLGLRGMKQRLLVVANRLPVSANRRGEDHWSLEISAGGLVSALLGNSEI